jgi:hypothetical protein
MHQLALKAVQTRYGWPEDIVQSAAGCNHKVGGVVEPSALFGLQDRHGPIPWISSLHAMEDRMSGGLYSYHFLLSGFQTHRST